MRNFRNNQPQNHILKISKVALEQCTKQGLTVTHIQHNLHELNTQTQVVH
jgi:hypothetical protein